MDLDKFLSLYTNVSREELEKTLTCVCSGKDFDWSQKTLEWFARSLHNTREKEKVHGRPALNVGPLIHVLSVCVQPKNLIKPYAIYGRLGVKYPDFCYGGTIGHELYKRESSDPQLLDSCGTLMLNGPPYLCDPEHAYIPLFRSKIDVELFDEVGNVLALDSFSLEDTEGESDYEDVKFKVINCEQWSLSMHYIVIPFGVYCRLEVMCSNRQECVQREFFDVNGKICTRYANTYGNYALEETIIFEKQTHEYERVKLGQNMQLIKYWVSVPAYSSIVIDLDLSEFETGRKIVNDKMTFRAQPEGMYGDTFVLNDLFIQVSVAWFTTSPVGPQFDNSSCHMKQVTIEEEMDIEAEDESSSSDEESSSHLDLSRGLRPHKTKPWSRPAFEIFSVFVGRKKSKALQIFGSIEVLSDDDRICCIFKRDESVALSLLEHMKSTLDVSDSSRAYEEFFLEIKCDIKDVEDHLAIKGYLEWHPTVLGMSLWRDKQLCNFFQGENESGFVAVHYSVFSRAVQVNIKVSSSFKMESDSVYPKVYGNLIAQYNRFDYSSRYNKEYYRIVLFRRTEDDCIQLSDSTLPLSRSVVVVPSYASLLINLDLNISGQKLICAEEIEIGVGCKSFETNEFMIHIELDWCEIK